MAGMGSRFKKIGIDKPKHEIIANGKTLFEWSLLSLEDFFKEDFIFIVRKNNYVKENLISILKKIGISKYCFVEISDLTDGQGRTVLFAEKYIRNMEDFIIYNIDTYVKSNNLRRNEMIKYDGFLPSFMADGDQWSFIKVDKTSNNIVDVAEKVPISNLGTIGLYYFSKWGDYCKIIDKYANEIINNNKELYIAPIYKYLIREGKNLGYSIVPSEEIINLGTPEEILKFDKNFLKKNIEE